jgi:hypothetical protein
MVDDAISGFSKNKRERESESGERAIQSTIDKDDERQRVEFVK